MSAARQLALTHGGPAALAIGMVALAERFGGYHARHWTWAALVLLTWACVQGVLGRLPQLRSPAGTGVVAGLALVAWTAASWNWAFFSRHLVWDETARTLMYVAAFATGASVLAGAHAVARSAAWLGSAIAAVGVVTAVRMIGSDESLHLFVSGRLDNPLGYSNATAAWYLIGAWLLLGTSCSLAQRLTPRADTTARQPRELPGFVSEPAATTTQLGARQVVPIALASGACLGGATIAASLALLGQSRGAVPALLVSIVVALLVAPRRGALLTRLLAIGALLAIGVGVLSRPYIAFGELVRARADEAATANAIAKLALHTADTVTEAGAMTLLLGVLATGIGYALVAVAAARHARRLRAGTTASAGGGALGAIVPLVAVVAIVAGIALSGRGGAPIEWTKAQWQACAHPAQAAETVNTGSHFRDVGTNRCDFWRVELRNLREHPVRGIGANNFLATYVLHRRSGEEPRQSHSLPLALLGELGVVGFGLGLLLVLPIGIGAARWARSGAANRDAAVAGAIIAVAYWLAHTSIDWLWNLPAVSLPALLLAGGIATLTPGRRLVQQTLPRAVSLPIAIGVLLVGCALLLPLGAADRNLRAARSAELAGKRAQAYRLAREASQWEPFWAEPHLRRGELLVADRQPGPAATRARAAIRLEPRNWAVQYRASALLRATDQVSANRALQRARALNPALDQALRTQRRRRN